MAHHSIILLAISHLEESSSFVIELTYPWSIFRVQFSHIWSYYINSSVLSIPISVKSWLIGKDWCWEGLVAGEEGDDRGWDGWMASLTRWTWVWVNSRSWWWTGRLGMLQFMGSQRVWHDWVTELNWKRSICKKDMMFINTISPNTEAPKYIKHRNINGYKRRSWEFAVIVFVCA